MIHKNQTNLCFVLLRPISWEKGCSWNYKIPLVFVRHPGRFVWACRSCPRSETVLLTWLQGLQLSPHVWRPVCELSPPPPTLVLVPSHTSLHLREFDSNQRCGHVATLTFLLWFQYTGQCVWIFQHFTSIISFFNILGFKTISDILTLNCLN